MENELQEALALMRLHSARLSLLEEVAMQLIEQLVAPDADRASRFESGLHARTNALLEGADPPDQRQDMALTQLLAALLTSAGRPPQRG